MNLPLMRKIVANFSGISNRSFKGYRIYVDLFTDELLIKAPDCNNTGISFKFNSMRQLSMSLKQEEKQEAVLDIIISYPGNRDECESILIDKEEAEGVLARYRLYQDEIDKSPKPDFDQVKEIKTVALIEFNKKHDVKNYNYGTLLLSNKEINFISYNGKNFIVHLDRFENYFYYQAVILPTDILGYTRWVSIHKVSELEKGSAEIVTFLTGEKQSLLIKQLLDEHYEKHLDNKLRIIQKQWQEFNDRVDEQFTLLKTKPEVVELATGFMKEHSELVLLDGDCYFQFEHLLRKIFYQSRVHILPEDEGDITILPEVLDFFENHFLSFVKSLSDKHKLDNNDVAVYAVWKLLKDRAINYYADLFEQQYGDYFNNSEMLEDFLSCYKGMDVDKQLTCNIALFTYYLMKNYWKNQDNFNYYFENIKQELGNTAANRE